MTEIQLTPTMEAELVDLREKILYQHPIWQGKFFTAIEQEKDPQKKIKYLREWVLQMPHASYGFTTYVAHLMARAEDEIVRYLLDCNMREELGYLNGADHYPQASHYQMVCHLSELIGIPKELIGHEHPKLLKSSRAHVATHTALCRDGDFFEGLGTLFLIENLTVIEFGKVSQSFAETWPQVSATGRAYFEPGGVGLNYFLANMEADGDVKEGQPFSGHSLEAAFMIQTAIEAKGIDINNAEAIRPYLDRIAAGMQKSISCRINFVEGVYDQVRRHDFSRHTSPDTRTNFNQKNYDISTLGNVVIVNDGNSAIYFVRNNITKADDRADSREAGETIDRYTIIPQVKVQHQNEASFVIDTLKSPDHAATKLAREFITAAQHSNLPFALIEAFRELERQLPVIQK